MYVVMYFNVYSTHQGSGDWTPPGGEDPKSPCMLLRDERDSRQYMERGHGLKLTST